MHPEISPTPMNLPTVDGVILSNPENFNSQSDNVSDSDEDDDIVDIEWNKKPIIYQTNLVFLADMEKLMTLGASLPYNEKDLLKKEKEMKKIQGPKKRTRKSRASPGEGEPNKKKSKKISGPKERKKRQRKNVSNGVNPPSRVREAPSDEKNTLGTKERKKRPRKEKSVKVE